MTAEVVLWVGVAALGAVLLLSSQPIGRPRPTIAQRLNALRPKPKSEESSQRLFALPGLDSHLVPALRFLGDAVLRLFRRVGIDPSATARLLRAAGEPYGPELFFGQKIAGLFLAALLPSFLQAVGIGPQSGWPAWVWLGCAAFGFMGPDIGLRSRAAARRRELLAGVVAAARLLSLAISAGLGLEQALVEIASSGRGAFFANLSSRIAKARLEGRPAVEALSDLAAEAHLPELSALAGQLMASERQGLPVLQTLCAQASSLRERWRLSLIEAGEKAAVVMLLPIGLLILPAFFLVTLYPAAVNLLQLSNL